MNFILVILRNVISALAGIILTVLALRFVLVLLGVGISGFFGGVVAGIYNFSTFLTTPIATVLPLPTYHFAGGPALELATLAAILIYGLLASALFFVLRLGHRH